MFHGPAAGQLPAFLRVDLGPQDSRIVPILSKHTILKPSAHVKPQIYSRGCGWDARWLGCSNSGRLGSASGFPPKPFFGQEEEARPKTEKPKLSEAQQALRRELWREASAKYRERHREQVLQVGRQRAARARQHLKTLKGGAYMRERARERAREASARYRMKNREALALKQRQARKRAFIDKHGIHAYIQQRFDAPIPREPESESDSESATDDLSWGEIGPSTSGPICDYIDPCLKCGSL
ncbi:hypothetical protein B0H10DRAFT_1940795 [Mycena sp. CBHHK59/15]|nr:hypothetical protein B0H10DRAFT_1940795 [Mycena sp. CBHHK59/15]